MTDLYIQIQENLKDNNLMPTFFFTNIDFFETLTNPDERKKISATYSFQGGKHFIYFYRGNEQIGYLKLKKKQQFFPSL